MFNNEHSSNKDAMMDGQRNNKKYEKKSVHPT